MFYILIPTGVSELEDMRIFGTYSMLETVMRRGAHRRIVRHEEPQWCYAIGYDGDEELKPVFVFDINDMGDIVRSPY